MKKIYTGTLIISTLFLFNSCTKNYSERILGIWKLTDVDRRGWGGSTSSLPFREGTFEFIEGGSLLYTTGSGQAYKGSWDLREEHSYDSNGESQYSTALQINAINFTTQDLKSEYFNEIIFRSNNTFRGYIYSGSNSYVLRFER